MKRQIKFRAWDEDRKIMINPISGNYSLYIDEEDGVSLYCGGYMDNGDWNEPPLMQWTGFVDENGVEVYEGDVISSNHWNPSEYKVIFDDGKFCFVSLNEVERPYTNPIHYVKNFAVVGNIYEHPELLN